MDNTVSEIQQKMQKVLGALEGDIATIRTGRATPALIENVVVSVYGGAQRLRVKELATISVSDAQTLTLSPFDPSIASEIQKGIMEANIGLTPSTDGNVIRITIPPLSEERRIDLIKLMKQKIENGRITIRQVRHIAMATVKKQFNDKEISQDELTRLEKEIQKITDEMMAEMETIRELKEKELVTL